MDLKDIAEVLIPVFKQLRERKVWKDMFIKNGENILNKEHDFESEIFSQLAVLFSEENVKELSKAARNISGFDDIEGLIKNQLEEVFRGYSIERESRTRYIDNFILLIKNNIKNRYPDKYNQIFFKEFREENKEDHKEIIEKIETSLGYMENIVSKADSFTDTIKLCMTIDQVDDWLKAHTDPSIGLNFFNYEDSQFVEQFKMALDKDDILYIQGKTREEVTYYILYIIKNSQDEELIKSTFVVNGLDEWNKLKCESKENVNSLILIPNFNADEIDIIPNNRNIIIFGEEDFTGKRDVIKLKNRIRQNMYEKLKAEGVDDAYNIVDESNGLFSVFKRGVFKGKPLNPKWEKYIKRILIPALLFGKWTESDGDKDAISEFSGMTYEGYLESINGVIGGEDPFVLKIYDHKTIYKIANVEEAWEILINVISEKDINSFKNIALKIILSVDPIFELEPSQHFMASLTVEKPKYSNELKQGIIRSLIMLANSDGNSNNCNITDMQYFVDSIFEEIFAKIESEKDWFGISELLSDMVEASPEKVLSRIETEVENDSSPFWSLFEKQDSGIGCRNYYTHVLWALEKLLCIEDYVSRTVCVLAKLSERDIKYSLSNKPIETLRKVFCAWMHEINLNIKEKIELAEKVVREYKIGWKLLEMIMPTRAPGGAYMHMSRPKYRNFNIDEELRNQQQIWDTYKEYVKIAIKYAKNDLSQWSVIFKECLFFEFELENEVFSKVNVAISECPSDEEKFNLKEQIRKTLHDHRFHNNAVWSMKKEYTDKLETEVFNKIQFINPIYDYLYLFISYRPNVINPEPYSDYDHKKEKISIEALRNSAIEVLAKYENFDCIELINKLDEKGNSVIGSIIADKLYNNEVDINFIIKLAEIDRIRVLKEYINSVYNKKGNAAIIEILKDERIRMMPVDIKAEILFVASIDQEIIEFIGTLDGELKEAFWKHFWYVGKLKNDCYVLEQIVNRMIEYNNFGNTLEIINYNGDFSIEKHLEILEKILMNQDKYSLRGDDGYYLEQSFEAIYNECYPEKKQKDRIIALEIGYINVLSRDMKMRYLNYALRTEPELLSELIKLVYKTSKDENKILSTEEINKARFAYHILFNVKFCPCVTDEGTLEFETLDRWVETFLDLVDKNCQSSVGSKVLGECLAHSPMGLDNIFPHEAVRKIIKKHYTKDLENGFIKGVFFPNEVAVKCSTNGERERELSEKYLKYASAIKISSPKTSKILLAISKGYQKESEFERKRAENHL